MENQEKRKTSTSIGYLGHVDYKTQRKQELEEHCKNVVEFSEKICPLPELKNIIFLNAIFHDAGKLSTEYQLDFENILKYGDTVHKHNMDHATAGGRLAYDLGNGSIVSELISIIVFSHHGLRDCIDLHTGMTLMEERRSKEVEYELVQKRFFAIYDKHRLQEKLELAKREFCLISSNITQFCERNKQMGRECGNKWFYVGMYVRLLLSVLIDGDWTDTSCFFQDATPPIRLAGDKISLIWEKSIACFEQYLIDQVQNNEENGNLLKQYRQEISDLCRKAAEDKTALYRLTVPTGAGKTLSSLRFALHHAYKYGKQHIIYVAPFNSILEQNAIEIRNAVGNSDIVLEHHCNVVYEDEDEEKEYQKLIEAWDSPIIITSAVQMLNTLFSGNKSCIRRLHALCNSVVIFDEVQAFPVKCTELFHLAVNFLTAFCNTTVVLCSATQPTQAILENNNIWQCVEMVDEFEKYEQCFKRTEIIDKTDLCNGKMEISDLRDFALENLRNCTSVLVIVNTKKCAKELFEALKEASDEECRIFHLSNYMCAQNKVHKLSEIKKALKNNEKVICVSTQLVEAGVNFSFDCVIRSMAGLDNIIQAAGRCNRHKKSSKLGKVYIVSVSDNAENIGRLDGIRDAQKALQQILDNFKQNPEALENSLTSQKAIQAYYYAYYSQLKHQETKYRVNVGTLVDLLGCNQTGRQQYKRAFGKDDLKTPFVQAFYTAGTEFEVISEDYKVNIIVPYDDRAKQIIQKLVCNKLEAEEVRKMLRTLQRYTVGISEKDRSQLNGALKSLEDYGLLILSEGYYDEDIGVLEYPKMQLLMV